MNKTTNIVTCKVLSTRAWAYNKFKVLFNSLITTESKLWVNLLLLSIFVLQVVHIDTILFDIAGEFLYSFLGATLDCTFDELTIMLSEHDFNILLKFKLSSSQRMNL